jgi:hypothetical protein
MIIHYGKSRKESPWANAFFKFSGSKFVADAASVR